MILVASLALLGRDTRTRTSDLGDAAVFLRAAVSGFESSSGAAIDASTLGSFAGYPSITFTGTLRGLDLEGQFVEGDGRMYGFVVAASGAADPAFQQLVDSFTTT